MGVLDWLTGRTRRLARARKKELVGQLERAAELYLEAEMPGDAARVLLLQADAEPDPERRMVLCAQAARIGDGTEHGDSARRRKALLGFDLIKSARGATMHGELLRAAEELERAGEWQAAAEAYALARDHENEVRVLKEAGAIEQLEQRLRESSESARLERERAELVRRMRDLDALAERREALRAGRQWLAQRPDEAIQIEVDRIASRLVAGPVLELDVRGERSRYVLGSELTIGRAHADIVVPSSSVSRQHLKLFRKDGAPFVADLDTRNGTLLAGARISGPLPVGAGLELSLAGQVPVSFVPSGSAPGSPVYAEVAGERYVLPLGPLSIGDWQLVDAHDGDDRFVVLRTPRACEPPHRNGFRLAHQIELCVGDQLSLARDGAAVLRVPEQSSALSPT